MFRRVLETSKTIALVGASKNTERASNHRETGSIALSKWTVQQSKERIEFIGLHMQTVRKGSRLPEQLRNEWAIATGKVGALSNHRQFLARAVAEATGKSLHEPRRELLDLPQLLSRAPFSLLQLHFTARRGTEVVWFYREVD